MKMNVNDFGCTVTLYSYLQIESLQKELNKKERELRRHKTKTEIKSKSYKDVHDISQKQQSY